MTVPMSTREYADLRGISVQAVNKAIENNHSLPGVVSHSKSGRYRILMVDKKKISKKDKK
jgi:hypothetical protein